MIEGSEKIFSWRGDFGKFPPWISIYALPDGGLKIILRGEELVLPDGFIEPGNFETLTIPKEKVIDLIVAFSATLQMTGCTHEES